MNARTASPIGQSASETARGFHQCWYPLALASECMAGQVVGRDFLGTRVVIYRNAADEIVVQSAWCPHLGADLSVGALVDGQLRCAYHHWRFDTKGVCVHIPTGDKIPPGAGIATYPSAEAWGLVWAFNGSTPTFDPPRIPDAREDELVVETYRRGPRNIDPWVGVSNGVDFQHLQTLHGFPAILTPEALTVDEHSIEFSVSGPGYSQHGLVSGTNSFAQHLTTGSNEMFMLFTGCSIAAGKSMGYYVIGVRNGAPPAERQARLTALKQFVDKLHGEDDAVLSTIRFRKGVLIAADQHLSRFLKYVDGFPRAEPLAGA
jgi:phenylpropionate dioxygenase-like ring-hydroxylating dioxygenase large terminal subunit